MDMETIEEDYKKVKGLDFPSVVARLAKGNVAYRPEWGGKLLFKQVPSDIPLDVVPKMQSLPDMVKSIVVHRFNNGESFADMHDVDPILFNTIRYRDQLAVLEVNNVITQFLYSSEDMEAVDWIVEY